MAQRQITQSIPAGTTFDPCDQWQYQYTDKNAILKVTHGASATGLRCQITATEITIMQDSAVPAPFAAGTIPSELQVPAIYEKVAKGKRLSILYTNPTGAAITINVAFDLTYIGGGKRGR